ncbi:hypothetical protein [Novacetimonas hansenii]|uniref:hypothetical protein n=1 Tax=Novacetimonas hansenii TaxID=436 RepID=UPI000AD57111|nr:hypothetical protein [Novacetimonas hansenii]
MPPFFKKAASFEAFWKKLHKKLYDFSMLSRQAFQKVSQASGPQTSSFCPVTGSIFTKQPEGAADLMISPDDQA